MKSQKICLVTTLSLAIAISFAACTKSGEQAQNAQPSAPTESASGPTTSKGIGPVTEVKVDPKVNAEMAAKGKALFAAKCSACHKIDERFVGPALKGVTKRRPPEWIMNQILNPMEMTQKDPVAKELLATYLTQMTFQNVTQDEARQILEFFRQNDATSQ